MKYKFNAKQIKWLATLSILIFNLALIGGERNFIIGFGISINAFAIIVFILLSIYPKRYYMIDKYGIKYVKADGAIIWSVQRVDIIEMKYVGLGIIPVQAEIFYKENFERMYKSLHITYSQYEKVRAFWDICSN